MYVQGVAHTTVFVSIGYTFDMNALYVWLGTVGIIIMGDLLWLGVIMREFYRMHLGHLMSGGINWYAAVTFYFMYALGIAYFAVLPYAAQGLWKVVLTSALLGAFAYATYDLTNHATLKDWPLVVTIVDIMWGAFLSALAGAVGYSIYSYFS
jgi:uncharacterized membrane protein